MSALAASTDHAPAVADDPLPGGHPQRAAASLRVGYVMSRFPKLTETFVLFEMSAVERQGVEIRLFPLLRQREATMHPEAAPYVARATYLPFVSGADPGQPVAFPPAIAATLPRHARGDARRNLAEPELPARRDRDLPQGRPCRAIDGARRGRPRPLPLRHPSGPRRLDRPPAGRDPVLVHGPRLRPPRRSDDALPEGLRGRVHRDDLGRQPGGLRARVRWPDRHPRGDPLRGRHERLPPDPAGGGRAPLRSTILSIGTLHEVKGQTHLVEACRRLSRRWRPVPLPVRRGGTGPAGARAPGRRRGPDRPGRVPRPPDPRRGRRP